MVKYTIKIDGMRCPKCEARVNNALKENFETKNVTRAVPSTREWCIIY